MTKRFGQLTTAIYTNCYNTAVRDRQNHSKPGIAFPTAFEKGFGAAESRTQVTHTLPTDISWLSGDHYTSFTFMSHSPMSVIASVYKFHTFQVNRGPTGDWDCGDIIHIQGRHWIVMSSRGPLKACLSPHVHHCLHSVCVSRTCVIEECQLKLLEKLRTSLTFQILK